MGRDLARLRELAGQFEGAFPYLRLIALGNDIADPLDAAVVEAYWLGSGLADRVGPAAFGRSLQERFRWGRILERDAEALVVSAVPLEIVDGRLGLGAPWTERIRGWVDGSGFVEDAVPGDVVAIHWDWACERLDAGRLSALQRSAAAELHLANQTL